ncbi:MAG: hypothetical protein HDR04_00915 [Lachnospiraceae bacterium]|nr:hypothetical protein [Lachnospiraceae bacterium]
MEIRLAKREDIPRVMEFIREYWGSNHILANKPEFMEYQHIDRNDMFTYIIAEENGKIYGVEGYIPMNGMYTPDIAGALWKVIPSNYFMLGKAIRDSLMEITNCRYMCSPGINMNTSGRVLGMYGQYVEKMNHYYRIRNLDEYHIAIIKEKKFCSGYKNGNYLKHVEDFHDMFAYLTEEYLATKTPYKDKKYIKHRYFDHPVYQYDIYEIVNKERRSFVIMREVEVNHSKAAKIIDYIGEDEDLIGLEGEWDRILEERGYEYIDFYCYGISDDIMCQSGFIKRESNDVNIIPNYFEPFEARNVDIYFVSNVLDKLHLYRGDGDQDRPSSY